VSSLAGSDVPAESLQVFHEAFAGDDSTGVILLAVVLQFAGSSGECVLRPKLWQLKEIRQMEFGGMAPMSNA